MIEMNTHFKLLIVLAFVVLTFSSCKRVEGEGTVVTEELSIDYFTGVSNNTSHSVIIKYGEELKVIAIGESNIIERVKTYVDDDVWSFELESGNYTNYSLSIEITMPEIDFIELKGSGKIEVSDIAATEEADDLTIINKGSGQIYANSMSAYEELDCEAYGSGSVELSDINYQGEELSLENSGSGNISIANSTIIAEELEAKNSGSGSIKITSSDASIFQEAEVVSNGSGDIEFLECITHKWSSTQNGSGAVKAYVMDELSIVINGSGSFTYKGSPTITKQEVTGSGEVNQL